MKQSSTTSAGEHTFTAAARREHATGELPITVKERMPANLAFQVELANLHGKGLVPRQPIFIVVTTSVGSESKYE